MEASSRDLKNTYRLLNEQMVNNYFLARLDRSVREHLLAFARLRRSNLSASLWKTLGVSLAAVVTILALMPGDPVAKGLATLAVVVGGCIGAVTPWRTLRQEKKADLQLGKEERLSERELLASRRAGIATEIRQAIVRVKVTKEMLALEPEDSWTKDVLEYWRQDVRDHLAMLEETANDALWKGAASYRKQLVAWCQACE